MKLFVFMSLSSARPHVLCLSSCPHVLSSFSSLYVLISSSPHVLSLSSACPHVLCVQVPLPCEKQVVRLEAEVRALQSLVTEQHLYIQQLQSAQNQNQIQIQNQNLNQQLVPSRHLGLQNLGLQNLGLQNLYRGGPPPRPLSAAETDSVST